MKKSSIIIIVLAFLNLGLSCFTIQDCLLLSERQVEWDTEAYAGFVDACIWERYCQHTNNHTLSGEWRELRKKYSDSRTVNYHDQSVHRREMDSLFTDAWRLRLQLKEIDNFQLQVSYREVKDAMKSNIYQW